MSWMKAALCASPGSANTRSGLSGFTITLMPPILPSPSSRTPRMGIHLIVPSRFTPGKPSTSSTPCKFRTGMRTFLGPKLGPMGQTSACSRKDLRKSSSWSVSSSEPSKPTFYCTLFTLYSQTSEWQPKSCSATVNHWCQVLTTTMTILLI
jgi:hypothetical protein